VREEDESGQRGTLPEFSTRFSKRFRLRLERMRSGDSSSTIHDPNASYEVGASACK